MVINTADNKGNQNCSRDSIEKTTAKIFKGHDLGRYIAEKTTAYIGKNKYISRHITD